LSTPANTVDRPVTCLNTASSWLRATTPSGCSRLYHPLKLQLKLNLRAACVCDEPASDLCSSSCRFDLSLTANTLLYQTKHILVPSGNHNNAENTTSFSFCDRHSPNEVQVDSKEYSVLVCAKHCMYHMQS